jgi:hypothetical protein
MCLASKLMVAVGLVLMSLGGLDSTAIVSAQEQTKSVRTPRGGQLAAAGGHRFEVFFYPTGARIFPLDEAGGPVDATHLSGTATFYHPDAPAKPWFSRSLHVEPVAPGRIPSSLDLNIGLSKVPPKGASVVVELVGLGTQAGSALTFKVPLEFVAAAAPQPTAPEGEVASGPRYIYGPGYYGFGYYATTGPETAPLATQAAPAYSGAPSATVDGSMSGHTVGWMHRDWTTGRSSPLSRPWLRPRD